METDESSPTHDDPPDDAVEESRSSVEAEILDLASAATSLAPLHGDRRVRDLEFTELTREAEYRAKKRDAELRDFESTLQLKRTYGFLLIGALIAQLLVTNLLFGAAGVQNARIVIGPFVISIPALLKYDAATLQIYVGATMIEVAALVLVIVKNLFPDQASHKPPDEDT